MAQVPYSPISNVRPDLPATRPVGIASSPTAFGAPQAEALSGLGKVLDTASNELATRANAMQQLKNEADARDAASQLANQGSQIYADFRSKQGQDAGPEAFKAYQQQLQDLHEQVAKNLTNPVALNMYNNDAYSTLTRFNMWGATHSGEQLDAYQKQAHVAQAESAANLAMVNPQDRTAWQKALGVSDAAVANNTRGQSPDDTTNAQAIARGKITANTIKGMADQGGPGAIAANAMLNDPEYRKELRGEDLGPLTKYVQGEMNRHSTHSITDGVFDGTSMQLGAKPVDIERAKYAIGQRESGGNYETVGPEVNGDHAYGKYGVMGNNLPEWLKEAGQSSMTPQQFLKNPAAQDAVFEKVFGGYQDKYGSMNEASSVWFTGRTMEQAGASANDGKTTNAKYLADVNKYLAEKTPLSEKVAAGRAHAEKLAPSDEDLPDLVESSIEARQTHDDTATQKVDFDTKQTIGNAIQNQIGTGPMTFDALMKNPDFASAVRTLPPTEQLKVRANVLTAAKQDNVDSAQRTDNFNKLQGLAYVDQDSFKGENLYDTDLTADNRKALMKLQTEAGSAKGLVDPTLTSALKDYDVRQQMTEAGLDGEPNKEEYQKFVGALAEEIRFARAQGKELTPDEVNDKVSDLLKPTSYGYFFNGPAKYTVPLHAIPDAMQTKMRQEFQKQGVDNPTDDEMEHAYSLSLYKQTQQQKSTTNGR